MYWIEVCGYPMPRRYGGHPALEFCNTWAGWSEPAHPEGEWLKDYDRLAVWAGHVELLDAATVARLRALPPSVKVLAEARALRSALYNVLTGDGTGFPVVAAVAVRANAAASLVEGPPARWELPVTVELPLLAVARSAAELLCGPDRSFVHACPGRDCGWLFLDRRGKRRWCSMQTCGNRAKVRAHAIRAGQRD